MTSFNQFETIKSIYSKYKLRIDKVGSNDLGFTRNLTCCQLSFLEGFPDDVYFYGKDYPKLFKELVDFYFTELPRSTLMVTLGHNQVKSLEALKEIGFKVIATPKKSIEAVASKNLSILMFTKEEYISKYNQKDSKGVF